MIKRVEGKKTRKGEDRILKEEYSEEFWNGLGRREYMEYNTPDFSLNILNSHTVKRGQEKKKKNGAITGNFYS